MGGTGWSHGAREASAGSPGRASGPNANAAVSPSMNRLVSCPESAISSIPIGPSVGRRGTAE
jgi:hypothetical protein